MTKAAETTAGEAGTATDTGGQTQQEQTFTQADLDRIVQDRLVQQAKNKFGDYDDLKAKAGQTATADDRIAKLESELTSTKTDALRSRIAARFSVSTEPGKDGSPSDAELFLTGSDESTLTAQAQRLAARAADRIKQGNVAPNEGGTKSSGTDSGLGEFTRQLFRPDN